MVLFTPLIGIWDTHHKAIRQNAEELLDFFDERHFFGDLPLKNQVFMVFRR